MKRHILLYFILIIFIPIAPSQSTIGSWGDQGNGTYINPILNADYSDPDVVRVDDRYYMVCSEFHY
ncbi:MAG: beta-xylosidase, partial [Proteiniphilum sp.]